MKRASAWLLLLVVLAWYWPVALGARASSPTLDTHSLPLASWFADTIGHDPVPEWNPLDGTGTPAVARSEIAAYYPPNQVAYRLLDPAHAWSVLLVLHTLAAALFGRLLAQGFGLCRLSSLLVGIVFAGQGFFITHADRGWAAATGCWLPLAVWAAWKWLKHGSIGSLLGLAGVLAIQASAGHFQLAFMTAITLAALSLAQRLVNPSKATTVLLRCAGVAVAVLLAAGLAAAQLVPSAELASVGDTRGRSGSFLTSHSMPPWHLLAGQLAPTLVHDDPLWIASAWVPWQASPNETLGYVGLLSLGLALLGLADWKSDRRVRLWGVLLLVATALSLGQYLPGFQALARCPGFAWFPAPGRWSVVAGLWWALLAGRGLQRIDSPRLGQWCQSFSLVAILAIAVTASVIVWSASQTDAFFLRPGESSHAMLLEEGYTPGELMTRALTPATEMTRLLATGLAIPVLVLAAIAVIGMTAGPLGYLARRPAWVVLLVAIDLGGTAMLLRPLSFTWDTYAPADTSPLLKRLAREPGSRVISPLGRLPMTAGLATFDNSSLPEIDLDWKSRAHPGTPSLHGWPLDWWPLPTPSRRDTLGVVLARMPSRQSEADLALMQWTGTRRLVVDSQSPPPRPAEGLREAGPVKDAHLARLQYGPRAGRLPGAALYTTWTLDPDRPAARAWFLAVSDPTDPLAEAGTDPSLERQPPPLRRDVADPPQAIETIVDRGEQLELVLSCEGPGAVVLADQAYPGWQATRSRAGGQHEPVAVETAWGRWRMVRIPEAGDWIVRFRFASASHQLGRQISLLALAAWLSLGGLLWWSRHPSRAPIRAELLPKLESSPDSSPDSSPVPDPTSIPETD